MSPRAERQRPGTTGGKTLTTKVEGLKVGDTPQSAESRTPAVPNSARAGSEDKPKYQQMIRTEARLRPDQVDALAQLRRRVAGNRQSKAERITDNTLVRIAVDLLLTRADELAGDTEDALRESVTTEHPK